MSVLPFSAFSVCLAVLSYISQLLEFVDYCATCTQHDKFMMCSSCVQPVHKAYLFTYPQSTVM